MKQTKEKNFLNESDAYNNQATLKDQIAMLKQKLENEKNKA